MPPLAPSEWPSWLLVLEMLSTRGVIVEDALDGLRLGFVAQRRARAVGVDVVDFVGCKLGRPSGRPTWPWRLPCPARPVG